MTSQVAVTEYTNPPRVPRERRQAARAPQRKSGRRRSFVNRACRSRIREGVDIPSAVMGRGAKRRRPLAPLPRTVTWIAPRAGGPRLPRAPHVVLHARGDLP
jgi:hypothetical protein